MNRRLRLREIRQWLRLGMWFTAGIAVVVLAAVDSARQTTPAKAQGEILDRMSHHEDQLWTQMKELSPRIETYLQTLDEDADLGQVPTGDRYYLGILHFDGKLKTISFLTEPQQRWRQIIGPIDDTMTQPVQHALGLDISRNAFAGMLFADSNRFDRQHYRFDYVRREFLGQIRCYVFDVAPVNIHSKGSFAGRIWIEDQDDVMVRFNGTFWQEGAGHPELHFDSWRVNVRPGVWMPAYVYSEESNLSYGMFRHARYQAQTRLWGYDLRYAGNQEELTTVTVEGADVKPPPATPSTLSPVENMRAWEHQAEVNVLDRLERAGLLAPSGPVDQVLQTVIDNLIITNKLTLSPPVRVRVLLTTPLESVAVGHTIVLSRGLIDSLPDEASLAAMLAHELAHISLGQRLDTRYAFGDRMLFADQDAFQLLDLKRTRLEEDRANTLAVKLLQNSPYAAQLKPTGLFLRQLEARRVQDPRLLSPHLGNSWFTQDYLDRMRTLLANAPPLKPEEVDQVAALPLSGRLQLDPWSDALSLLKNPAVVLLSAQEKMPLQITPYIPYLQRVAPAEVPATPGGGR